MSCRSIGIVQLSSSKFAVVEKSHKRTLVPSRPVINRQFGSEVMASCSENGGGKFDHGSGGMMRLRAA